MNDCYFYKKNLAKKLILSPQMCARKFLATKIRLYFLNSILTP
jgi:hypothetical protein